MDTDPLENLTACVDRKINGWQRFIIEFGPDAQIAVWTIIAELDEVAALIKDIPHEQTKTE